MFERSHLRKFLLGALVLLLVSVANRVHAEDTRAQALFYEGIRFMAAGSVPEAIAKWEEALTIDPNFAACYTNIGAAYFKEGHYGAAEDAARKALKIGPAPESQWIAWDILTHSLLFQGRFEEAQNLAKLPRR